MVAYSLSVGADAKRAGPVSNDLANHYAHGDNKHPQDLVSATETVQNCNGTAAANTDGGRNNNREQHQTTNGETNGNSPETKTVSFRGMTMGTTTNKTEAQEITDQTISRTTMVSLVMPATNLDT